MLQALDFNLEEPKRAVVAGDPAAPETRELLHAIHAVYQPNKVVLGNTGPVERLLADPFPPLPRADAQRLSARAALAQASGALEEALGLYTDAAASWTRFGHVFENAHAHAGRGRCALALGADENGDLIEARRLFTQLQATPHVAAVDELLGGSAAAVS